MLGSRSIQMGLLQAFPVFLLVLASIKVVQGSMMWCSTFLGIQNSFYAEIVGAILAIKHYGFTRLWLKINSSLLCQAFSSSDLISLLIRGRWRNCLKISKMIDFKVTHISREENECVDKRANLRLDNKLDFAWYDTLLACIIVDKKTTLYYFELFS